MAEAIHLPRLEAQAIGRLGGPVEASEHPLRVGDEVTHPQLGMVEVV